MLSKIKRAQVTAEYALLIAVVVTALLGIQTYVKRGLEARVYDELKGRGQYHDIYMMKRTRNQKSQKNFVEDYNDTATPFSYRSKTNASFTMLTVQ